MEMPKIIRESWQKAAKYSIIIVSVIFYLVSSTGEMNRTSDSDYYHEIAENFHYNKQLTMYDGTQLIYWPPFYPIALSSLFPNFNRNIKVFNLFLFLTALLVWYKLADKELKKSWLFIFLISTSTPVLMIHVFIWSESLFLFLLSAYIALIYRYFKSGNRHIIYVAAVIGFLALLTRNAGIFILPGFFIGLVLNWSKKTNLERRDILIHIVIVVTGSLTWNIYKMYIQHNISLFQELFRVNNGIDNILVTLGEFGSTFFPYPISPFFTIVIGAIVFIYTIFTGIMVRDRFYTSLTISFGIYLLTWFMLSADIYEIGRFIAVILPIVFLIISKGLDAMVFSPKKKMVLYSMVFVWMIYPLSRIFVNSLLWGGYVNLYDEIKDFAFGMVI